MKRGNCWVQRWKLGGALCWVLLTQVLESALCSRQAHSGACGIEKETRLYQTETCLVDIQFVGNLLFSFSTSTFWFKAAGRLYKGALTPLTPAYSQPCLSPLIFSQFNTSEQHFQIFQRIHERFTIIILTQRSVHTHIDLQLIRSIFHPVMFCLHKFQD